MTTAEIFADYLGLTPEGAPWAFDRLCPICDRDICAGDGRYNFECLAGHQFDAPKHILTATSPLAEKPTPGWASVLLRWRLFNEIEVYWKSGVQTFDACVAPQCDMFNALTPERAMCLAMIDADPDLRARCEAASDWEVVK